MDCTCEALPLFQQHHVLMLTVTFAMLVAFLDRCPLLFLEKSMGSIDMDSSFSTWHRQRKGGQSSGCTTKEILRCASCSVLKLLSALLEANLETGSILAHSDNACCFR